MGGEEGGQARPIATNLLERARLDTPIVCVVIGEGRSGGALGIGIGDRVCMLEFAYYSVISPEGCAGILWKEANDQTKRLAADALKLTARDLFNLRIIDDIIAEPLGGAHREPPEMEKISISQLRPVVVELKEPALDYMPVKAEH